MPIAIVLPNPVVPVTMEKYDGLFVYHFIQ